MYGEEGDIDQDMVDRAEDAEEIEIGQKVPEHKGKYGPQHQHGSEHPENQPSVLRLHAVADDQPNQTSDLESQPQNRIGYDKRTRLRCA